MTGASGLIGRALVAALEAEGHSVLRLVRGAATKPGEIFWNPTAGELDASRLEGCTAIVNLAGANIAAVRWTEALKKELRGSRGSATRTLVLALDRLGRKPAVLVSASAVGCYGDRGDE